MRLGNVLLAVMATVLVVTGAQASGTLLDNAVSVLSFPDAGQSAFTPITADNDGTWIWIGHGGNPADVNLARYTQTGMFDTAYTPNLDIRSLYVSNSGQLYAKEFGAGNIHSITQDGVATFLFTLNDPDSQSAASFNADDSELYTMSQGEIRRYDSSNGSPLGSFPLSGWGTVGTEANFPDDTQMETNETGRILTYTAGIVSEWDLGGNRVGQCNVPISTPSGSATTWSFGVGNDDLVYLFNEQTREWEAYDVGITGSTPTLTTSWGQVKSFFQE